jgi:uncharacterized protein
MSGENYRHGIIERIQKEAKPQDKFSHQARLYELARRLAGAEPFDDDVLFGAAWLHDIGVFVGHRPEEPAALAKWDNVAYAVQKAPEVLRACGFPEQKISAVVEVIRTHLPSGQPTAFEGVLLRDADILEQLGAVGILRTVSKVGRDTRFVYFRDALKALQKVSDELPCKLQLESARMLALERIKLLRAFLSAAQENAGGQPL